MKFSRRFFLGLTTALVYGIWTKYYQQLALSQDNLTSNPYGFPGIEPKPEPPKIININPASSRQFSQQIEPINFTDNTVPKNWLYQTPVQAGKGEILISTIKTKNQVPLDGFKPLPQQQIIANSWPDFTDAIDLKKLGNNKPNIYSLFYTIISFKEPELLRVCHGVAGFNTAAKMWLNNQPVNHGDLIRVKPGIYPMILEVYHGKNTLYLPWNFACLATRLTRITETEVEEVYQWKLSQWQQTIDMAKIKNAPLLAGIKFNNKTIRGKEGFFRVGQSINGKWWFIDPQGKAFYHKGCTGLNAGGMGGRRAMLPPVSQTTAKTWVNYLKEWGFNGMGSWTTSEFFNQNMPFTEIIETYYEKPWLLTKFPDVWNTEWAESVDKKCKKLCLPLKNNKMLLGYFLDNERGFMDLSKSSRTIIANAPTYRHSGPLKSDDLELELFAGPKLNPKGIGLLQFSLSQDLEIPASVKAWEFVLERYTSLDNLGKAWQIDINSKESIRTLTIREEILISEKYLADNYDFVKLWVEQYYRVCTEKIRKYDPNHLILGCRWGGIPGEAILEVEKEWADVVSQNNYRANFYEIFDNLYEKVNRPILNGEISIWSDHYTLFRNPIEPPGGYDTATRQKIRGDEALNRIFSHPGVLGYTFYRWHGKPDKLWYDDEPQFQIINPLRQANYRAVSMATSWDQPPQIEHQPLQGQIFLTLLEGKAEIQTLKPARNEDQASLRIIKNYLVLGLVCRNNQWDKQVYGDGIKGEMINSQSKDNTYQLTLKIKIFPTPLSNQRAEADYQLTLVRNQTKLEGTFTGLYNKQSVSGRAIAYVHRPVPTVRY